MKDTRELYMEKVDGEDIASYMRRFHDKTGVHPTRENFIRCYQPFVVDFAGSDWNGSHLWLQEMCSKAEYTWYGYVFCFTTEEQAFKFRLACSS